MWKINHTKYHNLSTHRSTNRQKESPGGSLPKVGVFVVFCTCLPGVITGCTSILCDLLCQRVETPWEVGLTRHNYESILPKRESSHRHGFILNAFERNGLLLDVSLKEKWMRSACCHIIMSCFGGIRTSSHHVLVSSSHRNDMSSCHHIIMFI